MSHARPDGVREGIHMERIGGVTSTVGLWHTVQVKFCGGSGADDECGDIPDVKTPLLRVWCDGVSLMPLSHGQLLANGQRVVLPPIDRAGLIGFSASNGQGACLRHGAL